MQPAKRRAARAEEGGKVFEEIRERISTHRLPPGSKLREKELSAEFGVSRARIREIFGALEQRGLIERIPNRGAVVVRLEADQVFNLYHVREALEGICARLATENAPKGAWDDLIKEFGAPLEASIKKGEFDAYMDALKRLNDRMIVHANNPILTNMLDHIYDKTQVLARRVIILPGRAEIGIGLHRELLQAMAAGNAVGAEKLKRKIISSAREYIVRYRDFIL